MLKIIFLITLFATVFSNPSVDGFRDISDSVPKKNLAVPPFPSDAVEVVQTDREQQIRTCADICLAAPYFCNSFALVKHNNELYCIRTAVWGSLNKESDVAPNDVLAAYERDSQPSEDDLVQRFFNYLPPEELSNDVSQKYAINKDFNKIIATTLKASRTALNGKLPEPVDIPLWISGQDLSMSRAKLPNNFKQQLSEAVRSWLAWTKNPQVLLQSSDTLTLTFLDIFFRSLNERITTIYDPTKKILIVEESEKHLLIRSFGPGDYVFVFAQDEESSPLTPHWYSTGLRRSRKDKETSETFEMFRGAMERFHHEVSDELPKTDYRTIWVFGEPRLSLNVILDALTFVLSGGFELRPPPGSEIFLRDVVVAVISSVIESDEPLLFWSKLHKATVGSGIGDVDIITKN